MWMTLCSFVPAQNIAKRPLEPYGFEITWDWVPQQMSEVTQNPPLVSYYAVLAGIAFGVHAFAAACGICRSSNPRFAGVRQQCYVRHDDAGSVGVGRDFLA